MPGRNAWRLSYRDRVPSMGSWEDNYAESRRLAGDSATSTCDRDTSANRQREGKKEKEKHRHRR